VSDTCEDCGAEACVCAGNWTPEELEREAAIIRRVQLQGARLKWLDEVLLPAVMEAAQGCTCGPLIGASHAARLTSALAADPGASAALPEGREG